MLDRVAGRIDDSTSQFTRSGAIRFTVPLDIDAFPASYFRDLQASTAPTALAALTSISKEIGDKLITVSEPEFHEALTGIANDLKSKAVTNPTVRNLLEASLRDAKKVQGWLRITLSPDRDRRQMPKLRMLTFNAVSATHSATVRNIIWAMPTVDQVKSFVCCTGIYWLDSLELVIAETPAELKQPLTVWKEIDSLDRADGNGPRF